MLKQDYYPFGELMPGRTYSSSTYKFGYQGSLKDDEIKGTGNSYSTFFRENDTRLGIWWGTDPKPNASWSPYLSMANNPIRFNDILGDSAWPIKNQWNNDYIQKYRQTLNDELKKLNNEGKDFTCDDLALECIISFASKNNLPFQWTTGSGTYDAADDKYTNTDAFLLDVKQHSGAPDFANNANTTKINPDNIQTGTLNVLKANGKTVPNHIQVISSVYSITPTMQNGFKGGVVAFIAAQGNFKTPEWIWNRYTGSDDPTSLRYLGVPLQVGIYDVKSNLWINITEDNKKTSNFLGGHYTNQYRDFNFTNFNR